MGLAGFADEKAGFGIGSLAFGLSLE